MSWREKERKRQRKKKLHMSSYLQKKLRSSDSFVLSGDILFTMFPKSCPLFLLPFLSSFLPSLNSNSNSLKPVQVFQEKKKKKFQTVTGMLDSGSKQTLIGFSCPQTRHSPGPACSFLNTRKDHRDPRRQGMESGFKEMEVFRA